jgi:KDO2-lipid IV(A) lauroyltransferase
MDDFSKRLKWRIEATAHAAVGAVIRQLPAETVFALGEFLGKLIWPLMSGRRNSITRNLRIAGMVDAEGSDEAARLSFIRTVANLMCSSVSAKSRGPGLADLFEVENPELLEDAVSKGKGVVLLLAHMGNWELLTRLHQGTFPEGAKLGGFYRPLNNPILNERVLREREAEGARLFSKRDSLHHVSGFLRENGVVGILADQRAGPRGELVEFFGRLTRASPLPSLLARRCKSEVLALSFRTVSPGKWSARYHPVAKPYSSEHCMKALEDAMSVSLIDVFWLQERWRAYVGKKVWPVKWLGNMAAQGSKPHRVLVWATEAEKDLPLPPSCIHPDIEHEYAIDRRADELEGIDRSKQLPIDYMLMFSKNTELRKKARELGIPAFPVSAFSE